MTEPTPRAPGAFASALATAKRTAMFAGRATRSEVITYALATLLVSVPASFLTGLVLPYERHLLVQNVLTLLLAIPVPAVLVRRFHDSGRSGSWVWLAVAVFAIWAARTIVSATGGVDARLQLDRATGLIDWLVILANLVSVILVLLPGTPGPNRFGDDPRGGAREA
ncbi:DUF805 domain-containing protein [Novosphingobium sp.]|uniref:DUF805 domain-containing protein n=1 Tax=Novosphingobium sp. TaxID=1874826 RepID=UPI0035B27684